jgi:hypothetical protein
VWFPPIDEGPEGVAVGFPREAFDALQGVDGCEVAKREDVGPLQDENQVNVDCPVTDAF